MKPLTEHTSVGEWKKDVEKEGFAAGTQVCRGLSNTMSRYHMTFAEAYEFLMKSEMLLISGQHFIIDLRVT